jgi:hypothetical protein
MIILDRKPIYTLSLSCVCVCMCVGEVGHVYDILVDLKLLDNFTLL